MGETIKTISRIAVDRLFGYYDYRLPRKTDRQKELDKFFILYGDNGAGKTTILRLAFALLSFRRARGDKSYVASVPFQRFAIDLSDGTTVSADRDPESLTGSFTVSIGRKGKRKQSFFCEASASNRIVYDRNPDIPGLLKALRDLDIEVFFLPDDRRIQTISEFEARFHYGRRLHQKSATNLYYNEDTGQIEPTPIGGAHHLDITPMLKTLSAWLSQRVIAAGSSGSQSANTTYVEMIRRLAQPRAAPKEKERGKIEAELKELNDRVAEYVKFGLATPFPGDQLTKIVSKTSLSRRPMVLAALQPFIESTEIRLTALSEIRDLIDMFVSVVNSFLSRKSLSFSMTGGIQVTDNSGQALEPDYLSSGEKQLLFILGSTLLARQKPTIFLIDEPELSLNIKWQRRLLETLTRFSKGTGIQFVLASHALELISKYDHNAVRL